MVFLNLEIILPDNQLYTFWTLPYLLETQDNSGWIPGPAEITRAYARSPEEVKKRTIQTFLLRYS